MLTQLQGWLLPPGSFILLLLIGLLLSRSKAGKIIVWLTLVSFYLMTTPYVASFLFASLNQFGAPSLEELRAQQGQAIMVLGGGKQYTPAGPVLSNTSLARLRYGALLHQKFELPIITVGGLSKDIPESVSGMMAKKLTENYQIQQIWIEPSSRNTLENALLGQQVLNRLGVKKFYLVTSSWHMPRAMWIFKKLGMEPIPAPTDFRIGSKPFLVWDSWTPNSGAFFLSCLGVREYIGWIYYSIYA